MTHPLYAFLYMLAAVLFLVGSFVSSARFSLIAAGLFAWVLVPLLTVAGVG